MAYFELLVGCLILQLIGCYYLGVIKKKHIEDTELAKELKRVFGIFSFVLAVHFLIVGIMTIMRICFS